MSDNSTATEIIFKDVPGFPGYRVGSDGSVWSLWERGRWKRLLPEYRRLKTPPDDHGYPQVNLTSQPSGKKCHFKVYKLIAWVFLGEPPEGMICRHLDDNKLNNCVSNLAYGTYLDNSQDAIRNRKTIRGDKSPSSKLSWDIVAEIRKRVADGEQQKLLAKEFGVCVWTIYDVVQMRSWVPYDYAKPTEHGDQ